LKCITFKLIFIHCLVNDTSIYEELLISFNYTILTFSQEINHSKTTNQIIFNPEVLLGVTGESNSSFPDHKL